MAENLKPNYEMSVKISYVAEKDRAECFLDYSSNLLALLKRGKVKKDGFVLDCFSSSLDFSFNYSRVLIQKRIAKVRFAGLLYNKQLIEDGCVTIDFDTVPQAEHTVGLMRLALGEVCSILLRKAQITEVA